MDPVTGLALGRVAVGVTSLARPDLAARVLRLDPAADVQVSYIARLFGAREVALGLLTVTARGRARRDLVVAGVAVDAGDAITSVVGARQGAVPRLGAAALLVPALGAVATGLRHLAGSR